MFDHRLMNLILCSSEKDILDSLNLDELVTIWEQKTKDIFQFNEQFTFIFFTFMFLLKLLFYLYVCSIKCKLIIFVYDRNLLM